MTNQELDQSRAQLAQKIEDVVFSTPVFDIHTHLYDPSFGDLLLYGIDDLLTYHYLVAEVFRYLDIPCETFESMSKAEQATLVWDHLFLQHSPVSEACRGVLTALNRLGLDVRRRDLPALRKWFSEQDVGAHVTRCMELGSVRKICMTNSPFDPVERRVWERGFDRDERFVGGLRLDPLLLDWANTAPLLSEWGYDVSVELSDRTVAGARKFLDDWTRRIGAYYLMASLPPSFSYPDGSGCSQVLEQVVLPHCRDAGLPLALMIGVNRAVNPQLGLAGDGMGRSDLSSLQNLCAAFPENRFLCTVLSRENQQELCVLARKFRNLHVFGCWWFTNVPYIVEEMTRMRLELIGLSVTPQHSDARVLDQIIYKWNHSRRVIADVLVDEYSRLVETGWQVTDEELKRDIADLFGGAFERFCRR